MLNAALRLVASSLRYSSDLILPPLCVSCSALITRHNLLCASCWRGLHLITPPVCHRLGIPLPGFEGPGPHISATALAEPPVFFKARAAAHYAGIIRRLIVRFKFEDRHDPLPLFIRLMREAGSELLAEADLLVPVPLHRLRLLQRRFNQSALLAKGLAKVSGKPAELTLLRRVRRTSPQVGLPKDERESNVAAAFWVKNSARKPLRRKNILLIDDVMTTGATANACARALKEAGAETVNVLTIALVAPGAAGTVFPEDTGK